MAVTVVAGREFHVWLQPFRGTPGAHMERSKEGRGQPGPQPWS